MGFLSGRYTGSSDNPDYNTGFGSRTLYANTTGEKNVAMGGYALNQNTTATLNTALGYNSMYANTTGQYNTAVGANALDANTTASSNTAVGYDAMTANTTGSQNTAVGVQAMQVSTTAAYNTAVGYHAGDSLTDGEDNTLIGVEAGSYANAITTGDKNTVVGAYARLSAAGGTGQTVIGRYALGQGNSTATIGIDSNGCHIALDGSTTSWSAHSDERLKENIVDSTAGLSFINDLRPITYNWKSKKDISDEFVNYYDADSDEPVQGSVKQTNHGFVAQEVKAVIDSHSEIKEGHAIWRESPDGVQNIAEGALMPMMVKAVQELSAKVEELENKLK